MLRNLHEAVIKLPNNQKIIPKLLPAVSVITMVVAEEKRKPIAKPESRKLKLDPPLKRVNSSVKISENNAPKKAVTG